MPEVSYVPGSMTAVVGEGCLALVDGPPDSPAVALIWQQFGQQAPATAILSDLLGTAFAGAESFVLLAPGGDGRLRLFCRGTVGATALGGAVPAWFDGAALSTWSEHLIGGDVTRVVVGEPTADRPWCLPASAGVLLAECVIIDLAAPAAGAGSPRLAAGASQAGAGFFATDSEFPDVETLRTIRLHSKAGVPVVLGEPSAGEVAPADEVPGDELPAGETANDPPPASAPAPAPSVAAPAPSAAAPAPSAAAPAPSAAPAPAPRAAPAPAPASRPVPAPAPPAPAPPPAPSPSAPPARPAASAPLPAPAANDPDTITIPEVGQSGIAGIVSRVPPPSSAAPAVPPGQPLIESVPWAAGPGGSGVAGAGGAGSGGGGPASSAHLGEPDGATHRRAEPGPGGGPAVPPDRIGPMVAALICPAGHANPPSGGACRWCGVPLPPDPVQIPRPVLGVLRLSVGDVITLDRGVLMGRNPSADFDAGDGAERPHVVKLPSDDGDISRTHLRVTLDGWHVLVTDLNSTNGTLVALPGREPEQLRPGEPMPILPGTVVILAEGVEFRYEVTG